jgi:hypothetical protein
MRKDTLYNASRNKSQTRLVKQHKRIKTICPVCNSGVRRVEPRVIIYDRTYHLWCFSKDRGFKWEETPAFHPGKEKNEEHQEEESKEEAPSLHQGIERSEEHEVEESKEVKK